MTRTESGVGDGDIGRVHTYFTRITAIAGLDLAVNSVQFDQDLEFLSFSCIVTTNDGL